MEKYFQNQEQFQILYNHIAPYMQQANMTAVILSQQQRGRSQTRPALESAQPFLSQQTLKSTQKHAHSTPQDKILLSILQRLSHQAYESLRVLDGFGGLVFAMPSDPNHSDDELQRKEAARLVGQLKGGWKFSYGEDVDYCIVSSRYFQPSSHQAHYGQQGLTLDNVVRPLLGDQKSSLTRMSEEESRWLTVRTRAKIVDMYGKQLTSRLNKSDLPGNKINTLPPQLQKAIKTIEERKLLNPELAVKNTENVHQTERRPRGVFIDIKDFLNAAYLIKSGMVDFHRERIFSLQLAEEQKRPENGAFNKQNMLVISKIDILSKARATFQIDPLEKQAYWEFDKLPTDPTKIAYDLYSLHLDADPAFNIVATETEIKYCKENINTIRKLREKAVRKDTELCRSDLSLMQQDPVTRTFANPVPNHLHCGVCRVSFEDYHSHIATNEHKSQISVHKNMYDFIDRELEDIANIAKKKVWKTSPIRDAKPQTPTLPLRPVTVKQIVHSGSKQMITSAGDKSGGDCHGDLQTSMQMTQGVGATKSNMSQLVTVGAFSGNVNFCSNTRVPNAFSLGNVPAANASSPNKNQEFTMKEQQDNDNVIEISSGSDIDEVSIGQIQDAFSEKSNVETSGRFLIRGLPLDAENIEIQFKETGALLVKDVDLPMSIIPEEPTNEDRVTTAQKELSDSNVSSLKHSQVQQQNSQQKSVSVEDIDMVEEQIEQSKSMSSSKLSEAKGTPQKRLYIQMSPPQQFAKEESSSDVSFEAEQTDQKPQLSVVDLDLQLLMGQQQINQINTEQRLSNQVRVADDPINHSRSPLSPMHVRSNQLVKTIRSPVPQNLHSVTRVQREYIPSHSGNIHNIKRNPSKLSQSTNYNSQAIVIQSQQSRVQQVSFTLKGGIDYSAPYTRTETKFSTKFDAPPTPLQNFGNPSPDYITGNDDVNNTKFANSLKRPIVPQQSQSIVQKQANPPKFDVNNLYGKDKQRRGPRFSTNTLSTTVPKTQSLGQNVKPVGRISHQHLSCTQKAPPSPMPLLQKRSLSDYQAENEVIRTSQQGGAKRLNTSGLGGPEYQRTKQLAQSNQPSIDGSNQSTRPDSLMNHHHLVRTAVTQGTNKFQ
ncbi:hypothetical protein FGO68_gene10916 [Halteria grandinella]|uniref:DBF4-type domain-containing protein n=1 Tax=Halteria grandinella TaxID=5974 RepID=A0A8J8P2Z1_HALGN|nr:hypothetical protein FGO68_gene10916 [Halteria grandinella]